MLFCWNSTDTVLELPQWLKTKLEFSVLFFSGAVYFLICIDVAYAMRAVLLFHDHYFLLLSPLTLPSVVLSAAFRSAPHWDTMLKGAHIVRPCHSAISLKWRRSGKPHWHFHVSEIHWFAHSCCFPSLALERGHMPVMQSQFIKGWLPALRSVHWHTCVALKTSVPYWVRQPGCGGWSHSPFTVARSSLTLIVWEHYSDFLCHWSFS